MRPDEGNFESKLRGISESDRQALLHDPAILIMDEPTAGLDPTARADLLDSLRHLMQEHPSLCVLLSSHIFEDLEASATAILILRHGRLVFRASLDTLHDSTLYRSETPDTIEASPELLLSWRRQETEWRLVRRGSPLDTDLRRRPDHVEEQPTSLIGAIYHGTERTDVD